MRIRSALSFLFTKLKLRGGPSAVSGTVHFRAEAFTGAKDDARADRTGGERPPTLHTAEERRDARSDPM
jgi:hypothetical protein